MPPGPLEDMSNVADALPEAEEAAAMAREKGWVVPQRYNYEAYNALNRDDYADALPWASNSAKYEWKEEYGDIGPPNEELEQMLFKDEYIPRVGKLLEKYVYPRITWIIYVFTLLTLFIIAAFTKSKSLLKLLSVLIPSRVYVPIIKHICVVLTRI